ncbi:MAG: hypothetical protein ACE3JQ_10355 [Paenisporosarcina sp.]
MSHEGVPRRGRNFSLHSDAKAGFASVLPAPVSSFTGQSALKLRIFIRKQVFYSDAPAVTRRRGNLAPAVTRRRGNLAPAVTRRRGNLAPAVTRRRGNLAPAVTRRRGNLAPTPESD